MPRPGKSHSLNTAIRESYGNILAFIDDDVTVESTRLQNLTAALVTVNGLAEGAALFPHRASHRHSGSRLTANATHIYSTPTSIWATSRLNLTELPIGTRFGFSQRMFE